MLLWHIKHIHFNLKHQNSKIFPLEYQAEQRTGPKKKKRRSQIGPCLEDWNRNWASPLSPSATHTRTYRPWDSWPCSICCLIKQLPVKMIHFTHSWWTVGGFCWIFAVTQTWSWPRKSPRFPSKIRSRKTRDKNLKGTSVDVRVLLAYMRQLFLCQAPGHHYYCTFPT